MIFVSVLVQLSLLSLYANSTFRLSKSSQKKNDIALSWAASTKQCEFHSHFVVSKVQKVWKPHSELVSIYGFSKPLWIHFKPKSLLSRPRTIAIYFGRQSPTKDEKPIRPPKTYGKYLSWHVCPRVHTQKTSFPTLWQIYSAACMNLNVFIAKRATAEKLFNISEGMVAPVSKIERGALSAPFVLGIILKAFWQEARQASLWPQLKERVGVTWVNSPNKRRVAQILSQRAKKSRKKTLFHFGNCLGRILHFFNQKQNFATRK